MTVVAIHEAVHHVRANNKAGYDVLKKFVRRYLELEGENVHTLLKEIKENRKAQGENLTPEEIMEELVADTISSIASSEKAMQAFLKMDAKERVTLRRVLQSIAERVKSIASKLTGAEDRMLLKDADNLLNLAKEMNKALKDAGENVESRGIQNTDKKYLHDSQKNIDSDSDLTDNEHRNNGGAVYGSQNTELLGEGTVSTLSGRYDTVWEQSESARKILVYLGVLREDKTQKEGSTGASDSGWLKENAYKQQIEKGFTDGILRALRGVKLNGKDTLGRILNKATLDKLKDTIFKDENGNIIPLYHWTQNVFTDFKYGDIGYHAGTVESAYDRYEEQKNAETTITGRSKKLTALEPYIVSVSDNIVSNYDDNVKKNSFSDIDAEITKSAEKHFGVTYSWKETGYILTNGNKLDFSGKHNGAPRGYRTVDHREIIEAYATGIL